MHHSRSLPLTSTVPIFTLNWNLSLLLFTFLINFPLDLSSLIQSNYSSISGWDYKITQINLTPNDMAGYIVYLLMLSPSWQGEEMIWRTWRRTETCCSLADPIRRQLDIFTDSHEKLTPSPRNLICIDWQTQHFPVRVLLLLFYWVECLLVCNSLANSSRQGRMWARKGWVPKKVENTAWRNPANFPPLLSRTPTLIFSLSLPRDHQK